MFISVCVCVYDRTRSVFLRFVSDKKKSRCENIHGSSHHNVFNIGVSMTPSEFPILSIFFLVPIL